MSFKEKETYLEFLKQKRDMFAWTYLEMSGLNPAVAMHRLGYRTRQTPGEQAPDICTLTLLLELRLRWISYFIPEGQYPIWLADIIPVKKKKGQIRICIDFSDLNKACPKNDFAVPHMELLIGVTIGYEALSFIDLYSRHHQIKCTQMT